MKSIFRILSFIVVFSLLLVACSQPAASTDDNLTVGAATQESAFGVQPSAEPASTTVPATIQAVIVENTPMPTVTLAPSNMPLNESVLPAHDAVIEINKALPVDYENQYPIRQPGDTRTTIFYFPVTVYDVQFQRLVGDDIVTNVTIVYPDNTSKNLTQYFEWIQFPAGGTSDSALNDILVARGLNITKGETLRQNTNAIWLGVVLAGTYIVVAAQDDPALKQNVGVAYIRFATTKDDKTIDISTIPADQ